MKKLILVFSIMFCFQISRSQDLPDLKAYRSDIGFNTSFLFSGILNSNPGPFDLLYKKQTKDHAANRFGTQIQFSTNANIYSYGSNYNEYSNNTISISIGKEIQKQITKYWIFYYGMDFAPYFYSNEQSSYNNSILQNQTKSNDYGLRVSPFLGLRFAINERLYVATETMLNASFGKKKATSEYYDPLTQTYSSNAKVFNQTKFFITPASGIFIFYRF